MAYFYAGLIPVASFLIGHMESAIVIPFFSIVSQILWVKTLIAGSRKLLRLAFALVRVNAECGGNYSGIRYFKLGKKGDIRLKVYYFV